MTTVSPIPHELMEADEPSTEKKDEEVGKKIEQEIVKGKQKIVANLDNALDELAVLEVKKKEIDKKHSEVKSSVIDTMKSQGRRSAETENIRVTITEYESTTIDTPRLREVVSPAILAEIERTTTKERVNVKLKKDKDKEEKSAPSVYDAVEYDAPFVREVSRAPASQKGMTRKDTIMLGWVIGGVAWLALVAWTAREMKNRGV